MDKNIYSSMDEERSYSLMVNGQSQITNNELRITNVQKCLDNEKFLIIIIIMKEKNGEDGR